MTNQGLTGVPDDGFSLPAEVMHLVRMEMANRDRIIICDIDGTLSDCRPRLHYVTQEPKNWKKFFEEAISDEPHHWCVELVRILNNVGFQIHLVSARPDTYMGLTQDWLEMHRVPYNRLIMREEGDYRKDDLVKQEILDEFFPELDKILFVIDDRLPVVEMWRRNGLICLQCNPYEE